MPQAGSAGRDLVVTYIEDHPKAVLLLLAAKRQAEEIGGRWRLVFFETPEHSTQEAENWNEHRLRLITRAKQMGAEVEQVEALSLAQGMTQLVEREKDRLAMVVIGKTEADRHFLFWKKQPWVRLVDIAGRHTKVELVPLAGHFRQPIRERMLSAIRAVQPMHLLYALVGVAIPALLTVCMQWTLPPALFRINEENVIILFIIPCAFISGRYGLIPGLLTAICGFFVENYFFTIPYYEFKIYGITDMFRMGLFMFAAFFIAFFTSHLRNYVQRITRREMRTELLFMLYRLTSESSTPQQAIETLKHNLEQMLEMEVAFFMPELMNPRRLESVGEPDIELDVNDQSALYTCWEEMKSTGVASPDDQGASWRFEPMITTGGEIGVLGVRPRYAGQLDVWLGRMLTAIADQTAAVMAHIELERSMEETRISEEREKLRSMLLSSVSHDLKTPLASIIGALSAYLTLGDRLKPEKHNELIQGSLQEARRLDSFITNILDMTRLETGNVTFKKEWHDVGELTADIVKRLQHPLKKHKLNVVLPEPMAEICIDVTMTGQVLQNLLDNACKYTDEGTRIDIIWEPRDGEGMLCRIRDYGNGIPDENLERIFDKFARLHKKDAGQAGTGLGLAIARAVMQMQNGWIRAENHPEGGAQFVLCLPQWRYVNRSEGKELVYAAH